jgi:hypothetical protein
VKADGGCFGIRRSLVVQKRSSNMFDAANTLFTLAPPQRATLMAL